MPGSTVAMVGFGAIGQHVAELLRGSDGPQLSLLLVKPAHEASARHLAGVGVSVVTDLEAFLSAAGPHVVEAGGQGALRQVGAAVLRSGRTLFTVSAGALADPAFRTQLLDAVQGNAGRLVIPCGAIAGIDGLRALREGGPFRATYTSTKPPLAWKDTLATGLIDLSNVGGRTCFFEGPADQAALRFPQNANIAATVALAGAGFAATTVRLMVDPDAQGNHGRIQATSPFGTLDVSASCPASSNPKTSAVTALSVVAALRDRRSALVFS